MRNIAAALLLMLFIISPIQASAVYTISNPRIVLHKNKHLVQIKWFQYGPKRLIVMKTTNSSYSLPICHRDWRAYVKDDNTQKYCYYLFFGIIESNRDITITDKHWEKSDQYYLQQTEYPGRDFPYGPFIPK